MTKFLSSPSVVFVLPDPMYPSHSFLLLLSFTLLAVISVYDLKPPVTRRSVSHKKRLDFDVRDLEARQPGGLVTPGDYLGQSLNGARFVVITSTSPLPSATNSPQSSTSSITLGSTNCGLLGLACILVNSTSETSTQGGADLSSPTFSSSMPAGTANNGLTSFPTNTPSTSSSSTTSSLPNCGLSGLGCITSTPVQTSISTTNAANSHTFTQGGPGLTSLTSLTTSSLTPLSSLSIHSSSGSNAGAIAGSVLGGVAVIAIICGSIAKFLVRRRRAAALRHVSHVQNRSMTLYGDVLLPKLYNPDDPSTFPKPITQSLLGAENYSSSVPAPGLLRQQYTGAPEV